MKQLCHLIFGIFVFLVVSACQEKKEIILTGLVNATEIDIASKVPGRIKQLLVHEGDTVKEGQKLVVIESEIIDAKLNQVDAMIEAAKAQLENAKSGARPQEKDEIRRAQDAAQSQYDLAEKMYNRIKALKEKGSVPQVQLDEAELSYNLAKDQLAVAKARVALVMEGVRKDEIKALSALVKQAIAGRQEVEVYEKESDQTAPIDGEVADIILYPGELAATGYPILTLVNRADSWVSFSVREDYLRHIKVGATLTGFVPALGKEANFTIFYIAAMGDFATWKATSQKDSFDLRSFEIKARPAEPLPDLRPGMTVRWKVPEL